MESTLHLVLTNTPDVEASVTVDNMQAKIQFLRLRGVLQVIREDLDQ